MRFGRLDLNLLVALDALLTERNVSLAAEKLFLSQSAASAALGRLRDYFQDDLLIMKGRQMILTARAESLVEPVRFTLEHVRKTIAVTSPFDPATCDRQIKIMASDYMTQVLLASAFERIERLAPNMRFEVQPMTEAPIEAIDRGHIDLLLTIDCAISADHPSVILFEEDYVVVGSANNPALKGRMTLELYLELGHVTPRFGRARVGAFDDWFLRVKKQQRRVEVVAPSFLSLPGLIVGTNRIATLHRRLAEQAVQTMPLVMRETPFPIPPIREAAQWNIAAGNDSAIKWVVDRFVEAAKVVGKVENNVVSINPEIDREIKLIEMEYRMAHPQ